MGIKTLFLGTVWSSKSSMQWSIFKSHYYSQPSLTNERVIISSPRYSEESRIVYNATTLTASGQQISVWDPFVCIFAGHCPQKVSYCLQVFLGSDGNQSLDWHLQPIVLAIKSKRMKPAFSIYMLCHFRHGFICRWGT